MLEKGYTESELGYKILKPIPNSEILKLVKNYRSIDSEISKQKILRKIFQHNLSFIVTMYKQYTNMMTIKEFISVTFEGVFLSIKAYDFEVGNAFITVLGFKIRGCVTNATYKPKIKTTVDLDKSDSIQFSSDDGDDDYTYPTKDKYVLDNKKLIKDIHKLLDKSDFTDNVKEAFKMVVNRDYRYLDETINKNFNRGRGWHQMNKSKVYKYIRRNIKIENYELEF